MSRRFHSKNRVSKPQSAKGLIFAIGIVALAAASVGGMFAYDRLHAIWLEQCVVTDPAAQAEVVSTGKMIQPDAIREHFGIRKGANLWLIDFGKERKLALEKYPTIRSIAVARRLPDKVTITVTEREPLARINVRGAKTASGRVVDSEGVVFQCKRGVDMLPLIREAESPGTAPGKRLSGRTLAALRLLEAAQDAEFQELGIVEVDTGKPDYLTAVLGNYQIAKIAWEGMSDPTPRTKDGMIRVMRNLRDAINARITSSTVVWNATEPDRVYADTKETVK